MKTSITVLFIAILTLVVIIPSCNKDDCEECNNHQEITLGVLLPLTGDASSTGESVSSAIDIALNDINQHFANIGAKKHLTLLIEDTQTDTLIALQKIIDLKAQAIQTVIGPYSSASVKAVKNYANEQGMLVISPSSVAVSLAIPDDNIFRLVPSDENQGVAMTALLTDDSLEVLVPIIRNDLWGNELLEATSQRFIQSGGTVIEAVRYSTSTQDFSQSVNLLKERLSQTLLQYPANKIGVYLISFGEGTDILHLAVSEEVLDQVNWYGSSAYAENKSLLEETDAAFFAVSQGFSCPMFGLDDNAQEKWQPLVEEIQSVIGRKPEVYALVAYDAVWLAMHSYLSTGESPDINRLKTAFINEANNYYGVTGRTELNNAGDRAFATYDFWGLQHSRNDFTWIRVAKYDNATGELTRY
ncbi:MAG: penicillin-binding protein activator [Bacteroidales bacterium]|nr:penicillin-binding protein activator [Bacteroidales bacterium]